MGGFELSGTDHAQKSVASSLVVPTRAPMIWGLTSTKTRLRCCAYVVRSPKILVFSLVRTVGVTGIEPNTRLVWRICVTPCQCPSVPKVELPYTWVVGTVLKDDAAKGYLARRGAGLKEPRPDRDATSMCASRTSLARADVRLDNGRVP